MVTKIKNMTSPRSNAPLATGRVQQAESALLEFVNDVGTCSVEAPSKVLLRKVFVLKSDVRTKIATKVMGTMISMNINIARQK